MEPLAGVVGQAAALYGAGGGSQGARRKQPGAALVLEEYWLGTVRVAMEATRKNCFGGTGRRDGVCPAGWCGGMAESRSEKPEGPPYGGPSASSAPTDGVALISMSVRVRTEVPHDQGGKATQMQGSKQRCTESSLGRAGVSPMPVFFGRNSKNECLAWASFMKMRFLRTSTKDQPNHFCDIF